MDDTVMRTSEVTDTRNLSISRNEDHEQSISESPVQEDQNRSPLEEFTFASITARNQLSPKGSKSTVTLSTSGDSTVLRPSLNIDTASLATSAETKTPQLSSAFSLSSPFLPTNQHSLQQTPHSMSIDQLQGTNIVPGRKMRPHDSLGTATCYSDLE
jgi:hypothetical protein